MVFPSHQCQICPNLGRLQHVWSYVQQQWHEAQSPVGEQEDQAKPFANGMVQEGAIGIGTIFSRLQELVTSAPSRRPQEPEKPVLVPLEFLMLVVILTTAISQEITVVQPPIQGGSAVH